MGTFAGPSKTMFFWGFFGPSEGVVLLVGFSLEVLTLLVAMALSHVLGESVLLIEETMGLAVFVWGEGKRSV